MDISKLTLKDLRKEEYEVLMFEYSSRDVADGVKGIIHDHTKKSIGDLHKFLLKKFGESKQNMIDLATASLKKDYENVATEQYKEIELLTQKFFGIPDNILLPADAVQINQYTQEDIDKIDKETEELQKRAKRASYIKACLLKEKAALQKIENMEAEISILENHVHASGLHLRCQTLLEDWCNTNNLMEKTQNCNEDNKMSSLSS